MHLNFKSITPISNIGGPWFTVDNNFTFGGDMQGTMLRYMTSCLGRIPFPWFGKPNDKSQGVIGSDC